MHGASHFPASRGQIQEFPAAQTDDLCWPFAARRRQILLVATARAWDAALRPVPLCLCKTAIVGAHAE